MAQADKNKDDKSLDDLLGLRRSSGPAALRFRSAALRQRRSISLSFGNGTGLRNGEDRSRWERVRKDRALAELLSRVIFGTKSQKKHSWKKPPSLKKMQMAKCGERNYPDVTIHGPNQ
jgi:hypothetical protein